MKGLLLILSFLVGGFALPGDKYIVLYQEHVVVDGLQKLAVCNTPGCNDVHRVVVSCKLFDHHPEAVTWINSHVHTEEDLVGLYKSTRVWMNWTKSGSHKEIQYVLREVDVEDFEWKEMN